MKPVTTIRNLPALTPEEFAESMREYAAAILPAIRNVPDPIKREPEPLHGPTCVCESCFAATLARGRLK